MNTSADLSPKEKEVYRIIKKKLTNTGQSPSIRELMVEMGYKSPRSVALLVERLINKKIMKRNTHNMITLITDPFRDAISTSTIQVPLVGSVTCGTPLLAEQNIEAMISVSLTLANLGHRYFLLRAHGDSMNQAGISDGDFVLVRQQKTAENGDRVVALIDDEATIKEFEMVNDVIILKPRSSNKKHKPIIIDSEHFQVQGVVTATIPNIF